MINASPALIAFLNSGTQFYMADLYTFTLVGNIVQRYTNADIDLKYNGNVFSKFLISRSKTKRTVGLEVDTLDIKVNPAVTDTLAGAPWIAAAAAGRLDGATILLKRIFMPTWGDTSLGGVVLFEGKVGPADFTRTEVKIQVKSSLELLDTKLPKNFFQSSCRNMLFDDACSLRKIFFAVNGSVLSGSQAQISVSLGKPDGWFTLGTIQFFGGPNIGQVRSIKMDSGGILTFSRPLQFPPSAGDIFTAYPGCDKTKPTCTTKFNNVQNIIMFPYIPDPEVAT